ncbi:MAG: glycosyltransferase [Gemmatimonadaceae bacterium]
MNEVFKEEPLLAIVLATDTVERVSVVIESLKAQTIADRIELVLVTNASVDEREASHVAKGLHSLQLIPVPSVNPLSVARAQGVRAARSPYVFIAETHAYPDADLAEKMVNLLSGEWDVVVPGFRNANPISGLSWAGFLSDYGAWSRQLPAGEIDRSPSHDAGFRRQVLLDFGDRLDAALTFGDELFLTLRSKGRRCYFDSTAGIQHVNINRFGSFVRERYLSGVLIGGYRSSRWTLGRRLFYAAASPLIPFVILSRIQRGIREAARRETLPATTMPAIVVGVILKAAGEMRGYLFGASESAEEGMTAFEVKKLVFNGDQED